MNAKVLQMGQVTPVTQSFQRKVATIEANVNFHIHSVANEDGTSPLCVIDLSTVARHWTLR